MNYEPRPNPGPTEAGGPGLGLGSKCVLESPTECSGIGDFGTFYQNELGTEDLCGFRDVKIPKNSFPVVSKIQQFDNFVIFEVHRGSKTADLSRVEHLLTSFFDRNAILLHHQALQTILDGQKKLSW